MCALSIFVGVHCKFYIFFPVTVPVHVIVGLYFASLFLPPHRAVFQLLLCQACDLLCLLILNHC